MANGRNKGVKGDTGRDAGNFVALPWSVLDSAAYEGLSHPARSLLMEIARQFVRDNNGRLLCSKKYLERRGWKSQDVITRAKKELLGACLIFETVMGHRPNKASWYAVTWRRLDKIPGYDAGAEQCFKQAAYKDASPLVAKPSRQELFDRHRIKPRENATLSPSYGAGDASIAPPHGAGQSAIAPPPGAMGIDLRPPSAPSHGHHLETPSPVAQHLYQPAYTTSSAAPAALLH